MRLINADALIEALGLDQYNNAEGMTPTEEWIAEAIATAPTIEAEPVRRGRWEDIDYLYSKCSVCGCIVDTLNNAANYCPNCGARMEGQE